MRTLNQPYYQFHRRAEEFDRTIRLIVAGLSFVRLQKRTTAGPARLPTDGEPFGDNLWNAPASGVAAAKKFVAHAGVAHIVTLLEDLCIGIKAEHDRFDSILGKTAGSHIVDEDLEGLSPRALYTKLGFRKDVLDGAEPTRAFLHR